MENGGKGDYLSLLPADAALSRSYRSHNHPMTIRKASFLLIPVLLLGTVAWWVFGLDHDPVVAEGVGGEGLNKVSEFGDSQAGDGGSRTRLAEGAATTDPKRQQLVDLEARYAAALSGFKGRLVDESKQPMIGRVVRFYRLDAEVLQNPGIFAEGDPKATANIEIHEVESDEYGQFLVTGAWPHSFYILEADAEGDNRLTRPVERLPGPGEIVDLGDIVLPQLGVIVGRVVDRSSKGVGGVAIRAMDIPSSFLELAPVERFDPEGALIYRFDDTPGVVEMPGFVKRYHDMLVRPSTVTMPDGRFRLGGVQPGENVMAFNKLDFVPRTRKGVKVKAGAQKDVGDVRMSEGEEAFVKVIDTDKEPVANAEILIGATTLLFPVDFTFRAGQTDAKGELYVLGIPSGKITVAARRTKNHPWVVGTPINVAADVVIKLPSHHHFDLTIKSAIGKKITSPEFKLIPSMGDGPPALDIGAMGFAQWIDLKGRVTLLKDGSYRIKELIAGSYTLAVSAPGHGAGKLDFKISTSAKGEITLNPESRFRVQVLSREGRPVHRAKVYIQPPRMKGGERLMEMPIVAGETNKDGYLEIREGQSGDVRLSASHPAYGYAHVEAELPTEDPITIQMDSPGELIGRLTEGGRVPTPGKWTIVLEPGRRTGPRGAMPDMPKMTTPNLEGDFYSRGLRPGKYRLRVIPSLKVVSSPGGMIGFMMRARLMREDVTKDVVIESGQPSYVEVEAIKQPEAIDGPAARVSGMVLVNGRAGKGMMVTGEGKRRYGVTVDDTGRFDFGLVPVGELRIMVRDPASADMVDMRMESHLWSQKISVAEAKDVVLDISVSTARLSGTVRSSAGLPVAAVRVKAVGRSGDSSDKSKSGSSSAIVITDQRGRFEFDRLSGGNYRLEAGDRRGGYGVTKNIQVLAGGVMAGVGIDLRRLHRVAGRVDLSSFGGEPPRWVYLKMEQAEGGKEESSSVSKRTGGFRVRGLPPGTYRVFIYIPDSNGRPKKFTARESVVVTDGDLEKFVITPIIESAKPRSSTSTTPVPHTHQGGHSKKK
jgi:hypothetical protein